MKDIAIILTFGLTLGMSYCNSAYSRQKLTMEKSVTIDRFSLQEKQIIETSVFYQNKGCVRGKAEPIIKKGVYHNTIFVLQRDSLTGIETVSFNNGDKLIIKNWGCEYYALTFRFETSRFQQETTNLYYWYKCADVLMNEMLNGLDAPIDIKNGLNKLMKRVDKDQPNKYKNLKLGEQIDFGGNDIRSFVSVDKIEKITDKIYAVEITFAIGPL
jgi:hypothetical protein